MQSKEAWERNKKKRENSLLQVQLKEVLKTSSVIPRKAKVDDFGRCIYQHVQPLTTERSPLRIS